MLIEPSPSPSPINVNVTVSMPPINIPPDTALDTYTGVLAAATIALAVFTVALAVIGWRALQRQDREIKATEGQLRLARQEFDAARSADRARLQVEAGFGQPTKIMGNVNYMSGREPAYDIEVWGRSWAAYSGGKLPVIMNPTLKYGFHIDAQEPLGELGPEDLARWPFPEIQKLQALAENEWWVGVTWRTHDGYRGHQLYHQPPGKPRENHPPVIEPGPQTSI